MSGCRASGSPARCCRTRRCSCSSSWSSSSASLSGRFLTPTNFLNILNQSAHIAIIAIGMTFVLLIAGIDLSVGANMYVVRASCSALFLKACRPVCGLPGRRGARACSSARSTRF